MNNERKTLDELANKYGTDKGTEYLGSCRHGYSITYDPILSKWRDESIRMLEVGVCMEGTGGGHSIYMWQDYFERANIYAFDIVDMSGHDCVVNNDRTYFYRGDQGNREDLKAMYSEFGSLPFDFVLEDGSHKPEHQMISFAQLFQFVKPGGMYILEDISIPEHEVCCIRNDETHVTLTNFISSSVFVSPHITDYEKEYLEKSIDRIELYPDIQDAYATAIIYKKQQ